MKWFSIYVALQHKCFLLLSVMPNAGRYYSTIHSYLYLRKSHNLWFKNKFTNNVKDEVHPRAILKVLNIYCIAVLLMPILRKEIESWG